MLIDAVVSAVSLFLKYVCLSCVLHNVYSTNYLFTYLWLRD